MLHKTQDIVAKKTLNSHKPMENYAVETIATLVGN